MKCFHSQLSMNKFMFVSISILPNLSTRSTFETVQCFISSKCLRVFQCVWIEIFESVNKNLTIEIEIEMCVCTLPVYQVSHTCVGITSILNVKLKLLVLKLVLFSTPC